MNPANVKSRNRLHAALSGNAGRAVRDRLREDLQNKASGLNPVVAAIVLWNTVYLEQAVAALERQGTPMSADCHLSPLGWEHIISPAITSGICVKPPCWSGCGRPGGVPLAYRM